jgi:hypothetical protein
MIIAAVAVVAILVGTSAYVMFLAPLKTSMSPDEITIDAGQMLGLSVSVKKGIKTLTDDEAVKYRWRLNPDTLASFNFKSKPNVNLTAGIVAGTGTLTCEITYKGETVTLTKTVTVKPPYLDMIIVSPTTKTLDKGMSKVFTASALDSVGNLVENLTYTWSVSSVTVAINTTAGSSVNLTAGTTYGNATLSASATWQSVSKTGTANVIVGPLPPRKIDYVWYKMFDVPFGDWWTTRYTYYKSEQVMTNTYPYMFKFYATPEGNVRVYANARLNITARNVTTINMNDNPEFLPLHGSARGGTAVIDWYMQYLTSAEIVDAGISAGNNDGWVIGLNGTVTLDKEAAMSVIKGLSSTSFDSFSSWWTNHGTEVSNDITGWIANEAGRDRLNINPAYDGNVQMMAGTINGAKVGDKVVLTYNVITWGMEAIIMRWLREAFMPVEYWFEDMNFHAVVGPEVTNLDIDTAVSYAIYAFDTTLEPTEPCWIFEGMLQDVNPSNPPDVLHSDIDPYLEGPDGVTPWEYLNRAPGNRYYGQMMDYDYTPGAWNLSANETLTLNWPSGQTPFLVHVAPQGGSIYASTSRTDDTMVVKFSEPMSADNGDILPGSVRVNNTERKIVFTGPIDMWHWGKNQVNYPDLSENWSRIDLLPHGLPWIEFQKEHGLVTWPAKFVVTDVPEMPVNNTPVSITISVKDNYDRAYPGYNGTIRFESNRTDVDLPADYTFDPAIDGGKHTFLASLPSNLTFRGVGYYQINVTDVPHGGNATGTCTNIWVVENPEIITGFGVEVQGVRGIVIRGLETDVKVTAFNQYPAPHNVFHEYTGTVICETNASAGTYELPPPFTFTLASKGMATLHGLLFNERGEYVLNVSDQADPTVNGTVDVTVSISPKIDYRIYDMFEQPWGDWWFMRAKYLTDYVLNNKPHEYTFLYNKVNNIQGIIYAPYRWNTTATNLTTLSVHNPEFMPVLGTPGVPGASVDMHIWFQYISNATWNNYWLPVWGSNWNWTPGGFDGLMSLQYGDGYILGELFTVSMNREASLEWLGMPMTGSPATWWSSNGVSYQQQWQSWIFNLANGRLDIYPGYEVAYSDMGTMMDLVEEANGNVTLRIAHFSWGGEVLMVRWLSETAICTHQPYLEDFNLSAHFGKDYANVTFDAVAQYNLHAVKANGTVNDPAWVWEPQRVDYVAQDGSIAPSGYSSEFNPWVTMTYTSWNAGDGLFGSNVGYDATPTWFNLTNYMTLKIQLPNRPDVIGYMGEKLPCSNRPASGAIYNLKRGNTSMYDNITVHGPMWLAYNMTGLGSGAPNLWTYYDNGTKTLSLVGPMNFDNYRFPNGLLYHAAPWIEFSVANVTWGATTSLPVSSGPGVEESAGSGAALSEMAALAAVLMATSLAVVALGAGARRKD